MNTLFNRPLPASLQESFSSVFCEEEPLFCVVGDLSLRAKYAESLLAFTKTHIIAFDSIHAQEPVCIAISDVEEAKVKRMYGNALFRVTKKDGSHVSMLRFSYASANVADAAAEYVNSVNKTGWDEELVEVVRSVYNKQRCFCPKCGRKLPSPEADCINCAKKGHIFAKLSKYIITEKKGLIVCLLLSIFTTAMALVPPYMTSIMVDTVLPNQDGQGLIKVILLLLICYVLQYAVTGFRSYLLRVTGSRIVIKLKKDIYEKAQYLPMSFYDKTSTGSVINRINSDTATLQQFILKITQEAVVQFFMLVGILAIMLAMNWRLTLFSLVPVPLVALTGRFFGKKLGPKYMRIWRRSSAISTILADTIPGIRVVKAFTNEKAAVHKFDAYCDDWLEEDKTVAKVSGFFPAFMTFLVTCGSLIIWFSGGQYVIAGHEDFSIGILVSFISYASMFYTPVNFFANLSDSYQNTLASVEKIMDILDAEPEHDFGQGVCPERIDGKIEFRNVNFSFDRSKKVLSNINLTIEPGDIVGIVGTTGSGKSTLINLLMRYYDEYDGEILIDGKNIKDVDMAYYRSQIGFVQQDPMMFRDTVFNNIAYGMPNVRVEQVLHAADIANAHGFICKLPDGYDTMLGERGVGLSGGERQRVSIARAILKNPGILIFDEATAAVDSETENLIQTAIERLIRGRTTLMIAHRLSTLRKANKIVVVDKGEIIECGPPEELLAKKGKYYKLVQIQSMGEKYLTAKSEENFE
ncbi:MAG: ABC transporter ATP-binding protein [Clostridia bacterium]|nr:ABC transporter ATP-binding protein [Clostridia bacterium]